MQTRWSTLSPNVEVTKRSFTASWGLALFASRRAFRSYVSLVQSERPDRKCDGFEQGVASTKSHAGLGRTLKDKLWLSVGLLNLVAGLPGLRNIEIIGREARGSG
jgi:hypothetical protein